MELEIKTERRTQLVDVTELVREAVSGSDASLLIRLVPHTKACRLLVTVHE